MRRAAGVALAKLQFGPYLLSFTQSTYNAAQTLALIFIIMGFVLVLLTLRGRFERWPYTGATRSGGIGTAF